METGDPTFCGEGKETQPCEPKDTSNCKVCKVDGKTYDVGAIISIKEEGCVKWWVYPYSNFPSSLLKSTGEKPIRASRPQNNTLNIW